MHESSRGGKIALTGLQWRKTSFDQLPFLIGALYPPITKLFLKTIISILWLIWTGAKKLENNIEVCKAITQNVQT